MVKKDLGEVLEQTWKVTSALGGRVVDTDNGIDVVTVAVKNKRPDRRGIQHRILERHRGPLSNGITENTYWDVETGQKLPSSKTKKVDYRQGARRLP